MLSHKVLTRQSVGRVANYYGDGADDYYAKGGDAYQWQGKGAEALSLSGAVDAERFRELLAGQVDGKAEGSRGATRQDSSTRIGLDLTFSAPKSVSLQALVHGDAGIIAAHDRAVAKALEHAEERAQARHKVDGKTRIETTGNLIIGKFRHETSREQDPQLHTHAVIMNLTRRSDGQWRALKNDEIVKASKYLGAVYRAELAHELQKLGYQIRHGRDGMFELAHISRRQLEAFSQRSAQVESRLAEKGLTRETATQAEKQAATMASRAAKGATDRDAVHADWVARARELGIQFDRRQWAGHEERAERAREPAEVAGAEAAKRALRYAVNHLTERQAVVGERELIDVAMKHGVGAVRLGDLQAELKRQTEQGYLIRESPLYRPAGERAGEQGKSRQSWVAELAERGMDRVAARERVDTAIRTGGLVAGEARYSTQTALEREKRILQIERDGRGRVEPLMSADAARTHLAATTLNRGQREAAELMVTTVNRVVGVQGFAGTGKSHMLDTARAMIEREGYQVRALAPYGSQVKALQDLGVEANTLASFLRAKDKKIDARTVLVIDEAGVVPTRQMEQALRIAEKAGARVVLMGDTAQTKAIEAGRPFDQLQAAGMGTAAMEEIQRQKAPELKKAVELAARGEANGSLAHIEAVIEVRNDGERHARIAYDYTSLNPQDRERTIIVSGTNDSRRDINRRVREELGVAGQGIEYDTLIRRDTTQAERRHSKNYHVGDVIQPEQDYPRFGLRRGELYRVEDTGPGNRLVVRPMTQGQEKGLTGERQAGGDLAGPEGQGVAFSPRLASKLSVYQPERAELAAGDLVRITRNNAEQDLANGDRFKVEAVARDRITLSNGKRRVELATDKPLHLDHAYATTVHSSQGLTADRVLVNANAESRTTAKDVHYVAISRARHEARIYTDSIHKLPAAIMRENIKHAALDLARDRSGFLGDRSRPAALGERTRNAQHVRTGAEVLHHGDRAAGRNATAEASHPRHEARQKGSKAVERDRGAGR